MRAKPCPVSVEQETRFSEGYDQLLPTLLAMPARHLPRVNLNILDAVITVLGVLPRLMALREQLVQALPQFDCRHLDMLEVYAKALAYADLICRGFPEESKELPKVIAEACKLRDRLRADAIPLAKRGLLDRAALRAYRGTSAHTVIAMDLQVLTTLMRGNWASIENRCAVSKVELDHADKLAARIFRLAGTRDDKTPWLIRDRAFQLFVRAYSEVRSAVIWLRREEGDADKIAPSLYRKHRRSRVRQEQEPSHNPAPQGPDAAPRGHTEAPNASAAPSRPPSRAAEGTETTFAPAVNTEALKSASTELRQSHGKAVTRASGSAVPLLMRAASGGHLKGRHVWGGKTKTRRRIGATGCAVQRRNAASTNRAALQIAMARCVTVPANLRTRVAQARKDEPVFAVTVPARACEAVRIAGACLPAARN